MAFYFLETSALVKRYVRETGTAWVQGFTVSPATHVLYMAQITAVEVVAAITLITLRARRGNTTAADAARALADLRRDLRTDYIAVELAPALITSAMDLAERHGLRGYDAVQLAAALEVAARNRALGLTDVTFICADTDLNTAARAEGLTVDDPNAHP